MVYHHRSSGLKQSNKSHKTGKASKRSVKVSQGGKVQNRVSVKKKGLGNVGSKAKANRAHMAKQRRDASRDKLFQQRRVQGRVNLKKAVSEDSVIVPRLVGIISLSETEAELETRVKEFLVDAADRKSGDPSSTTAMYDIHKREGKLTFLTNTSAFASLYSSATKEDASVQAALDLCRVCDTVVFLIDGRDAEKKGASQISGMSIGGGVSTVSSSTNVQQDYDHLISSRGDRVLAAIKAQGLPTPLTTLINVEGDSDDDNMSMVSFKSVRRSAIKRKLELKKYLTRFATTEFGESLNKVIELQMPSLEGHESAREESSVLVYGKSKKILPDSFLKKGADEFPSRAAMIRSLCTMSASPPKWITEMPRAYILSDSNGLNNNGYSYDASSKELKITGFIRGKAPWDVNSLVHLPNAGTFKVKRIEKRESDIDSHKKRGGTDEEMGDESEKILAASDELQREPLNMFADADALDGEQNLIGFEDNERDFEDDEMNDNEEKSKNDFLKGAKRPAGWSDYQSAWLDGIKDDFNDDEEEEALDQGELAFSLNKKESVAELDMDEEDANHVSAQERQALVDQRKKDQEDETMFPDEVDVDEDGMASERFARYRSLKSFRQSYWDAKENLPETYGTIFHFKRFKATQADIMADMRDVIDAQFAKSSSINQEAESMRDDDSDSETDLLEGCVASGSFVTIVVEDVSATCFSRISTSSLITAVSLLPHENKMSVLHMGLSQTTQCDDCGEMPIKSKDVLHFRCGWRTWQGRPVFSQNNLNSDKHKYERFMPTDGAFFAASLLGPVTYAPCPVLVFRKKGNDNAEFVALGSMLGADADRIVVKRIILTGYPTRVHKRHATVKYMFYNPEDVKVSKRRNGLLDNILSFFF